MKTEAPLSFMGRLLKALLPKPVEDEDTMSLRASEAGRNDAIEQSVSACRSAIDALRDEYAQGEKLVEAVSSQSGIMESMSKRVRELEDDLVDEAILKPLMQDFIRLYHSVAEHKKMLRSRGKASRKMAATSEFLTTMESQILDVMARHDALPIEATDQLDPSTQKVVGVEEITPPPAKETINQLKTGFTFKGRLFRPAEVLLTRYTTPEA